MKKNRSGSFMESTVILITANIIAKIVGALFTIPLTNLYGAEGNGIFSTAYYIYSALYIVSTAGLPVAMSRMVAEANTLGKHREVQKIGRVALVSFTIIGFVLTAGLMLGARQVVEMLGNSRTYYTVLAIAPNVFFVCVISAIRGYYQGLSNMVPTAISQVIEAVGKLLFGLALAYLLMNRGYSLEIVVAGAMAGVTIGTVLSTIYIVFVRLRDKREINRHELGGECRSGRQILKSLVKLAIPITVGASVMSLTNLIDTGVVMNRLQSTGMTEPAANYLYGAYSMGMKFFTLPQSLIVGIGISVIPAISSAMARVNVGRAQKLTESAFRLTSLFAFPSAVGLAVLAGPIMDLLYYSVPEDVMVAAPLLTLLCPAVFFVAMVSITNSILQANGKEKVPVVTMLAGGAVKLITNYTLIGIIGISGAPIGTTLCYGTITLFNLFAIYKSGIHIKYGPTFVKPIICSIGMGVIEYLLWAPMSAVFGPKIGVLITIGISGIFYLLLLIATRALPREDILMLPKGEKIAKFLKIK